MTALARQLARLIAADGPIPLSRYMAEALGHPTLGYYQTREPFGADGDFVTAPEVSQMFGELIGLWCAQTWSDQGRPNPCHLVELGPGRGTLMADALRAARSLPDFLDAVRLHLVETSTRLRKRQAESLAGHCPHWHDSVASLPDGPVLVIANEFFDALPVRQFQRAQDGWHERMVGVKDGELTLVLSPAAAPPGAIPAALRGATVGAIAEFAPASAEVIGLLSGQIARNGGALLAIDYGHATSAPGDTLQAVRGHQPVPMLSTPGEADLTAHVDFQFLREAAEASGAVTYGPVGQGDWLRRIGIEPRAVALKASAEPAQAEAVDAALARLTGPEQMGTLFKVLAVAGPDSPVPAGFEGAGLKGTA